MNISEALQTLDLTAPISRESLANAYGEGLRVWSPEQFAGNADLQAKAETKTRAIHAACTFLNALGDDEPPFVAHSRSMPPPQVATFGVRAGAFYMDLLMGMTLVLLVLVWLNTHPSHGHMSLVGVLLSFWLYFTAMEGSPLRATVGKWLMGIQVVSLKGERAGFLLAMLRFPCALLSFFLHGKRMFAAWSHSDNLLQDALSRTMVVDQRAAGSAAPPSLWKRVLWLVLVTGLMAFAIFLLVKSMDPENISLPAD